MRFYFIKKLFLLTGLVVTAPLCAGEYLLKGRVYDSLHGTIHSGIKLTLPGSAEQTVETDSLGFYTFTVDQPGPKLIQIKLNDEILVGRVLINKQSVTLKNLDIGNIRHPDSHHDY